MNKIIISKETDPYYNLALEEQLFREVKQDEVIFYLWQNEKVVVIGRNQNPYEECNLDFMLENNIKLVRRLSGGGTVFHDLGNLNFTFISKNHNVDLDKQLLVVKKTLEKFEVEVEFSGRNDLLIREKKISGHAFYEEDNNYFHHGTLMVNVDLDILKEVLNPSKIKLESKGIKSVKSRVINLNEVIIGISIEELKEKLTDTFLEMYKDFCDVLLVNKKNFNVKYIKKYKDHKWNFGESPKYNVKIEEKVSIGNIQGLFVVDEGVIGEMKLYSDTLIRMEFLEIEKDFIGKEFLGKETVEDIKRLIIEKSKSLE